MSRMTSITTSKRSTRNTGKGVLLVRVVAPVAGYRRLSPGPRGARGAHAGVTTDFLADWLYLSLRTALLPCARGEGEQRYDFPPAAYCCIAPRSGMNLLTSCLTLLKGS
jgi:hypothetical protein